MGAGGFNDSKRVEKYLNQDWKDNDGKVLRSTKPIDGENGGFFTNWSALLPFANDYEFEFAKELVHYEKLEDNPTFLLVVELVG